MFNIAAWTPGEIMTAITLVCIALSSLCGGAAWCTMVFFKLREQNRELRDIRKLLSKLVDENDGEHEKLRQADRELERRLDRFEGATQH